MADEHILNILIRAKENVSQAYSSMKDAVGDYNTALDKSSRQQRIAASESEKLIQAKKREIDATTHQMAINEDNIRSIDQEIAAKQRAIKVAEGEVQALQRGTKAQRTRAQARRADAAEMRDQIRNLERNRSALDKDSNALRGHIGSLEADRQATLQREKASQRFIRSLDDESTTIGRLRSELGKVKAAAEDNNTIFGKLAHTQGEASTSSKALERRLALLGRAMLGIVVVSALTFISALNSAVVGLAGQAIALAGSLASAGGALGGIFVAGISQAIPVVGILMAVMSRLTNVMNAVNEHFLVQKQAGNENTSALEQQHNAANQVADAQRGVADANRQVSDAERGLTDAHRQVQQAEYDLTQARQDAQRQVQDLMFAEEDEELQLKSSILSRKEAQQELQDAIKSGATPLEIEQLRLQVQQANQDVEEQRVSAQRAQDDADKARRRGIKSIDSYRSAVQALADAHRGVKEAERQVADAQRGVSDATRRLAEAHHDAATQAQDQSSAEAYLQYFLKQLSPAERELYHAIVRVKNFLQNQFTQVTDPIIEAFSQGIGRGLRFIQRPEIFGALRGLANDMADAFGRLTRFVTNPAMQRFFGFIIQQARENLPTVTQAFIVLGRIFRNIAEAAAPVLNKFLGFIVGQLREFNQLVSDKQATEDFFTTGFRFFKAWFGVIKGLLDLFGALMGASQHSAFDTLFRFTDTLHGAAKDIRDNGKEASAFFDETADALAAIGQILVAVGSAMFNAFDVRNLQEVAELIDRVLAPALSKAVQFIGTIISLLVKLTNNPVAEFLLKWYITLRLTIGGLKLLGAVLGGTLLTSLGKFITNIAKIQAAFKVLFAAESISRIRAFGTALSAAFAAEEGSRLAAFTSSLRSSAARGGSTALGAIEQEGAAAAAFGTGAVPTSEIKTSAKSSATTWARSFGGFLKTAIPIALAGLAVIDILQSAMKGDFRQAGIKLATTLAGAVIGFIVGGPFGAMIGAGVGDAIGHLLGNLFNSTDPVTAAQNRLASATRAVAIAFHGEKQAILDLRQAHLSMAQARTSHRQAVLDEKIAHNEYNRIVKQEGKNSTAAKQALLAWKSAKQNTRQTTLDLTTAQQGENKATKEAVDQQAKIQDKVNEEGQALADLKNKLHDQIDERNRLRQIIENTPKGSPEWVAAKQQAHDLTGTIDDLRDSIQYTNDKYDRHLNKLADVASKTHKLTGETVDTKGALDKLVHPGMSDFQSAADTSNRKLGNLRDGEQKTQRQTQNLKGTFKGTAGQARELGRIVGTVTDNVLKSFGVKQLHFTLPDVKDIASTAGSLLGGYLGGGQTGGWFGTPNERGPDDRFIGVAGGEAILTGWHQQAVDTAMSMASVFGFPYKGLGEMFSRDKREHRTAPGYQKGGKALDFALGPYTVPPITYDPDHAGGNSHVHISAFSIPWLINVGHKLQQMGNTVGEFQPTKFGNPFHFGPVTTTAHARYPTDHYSGHAVDVNSSGPEDRSWVASIAKVLKGGAVGAVVEHLKRIIVKGPNGPLKNVLQAQADKLRKEANKFVDKKAPSETGGVSFAGINADSIKALAHKMVLAAWGASQWPPFDWLEMHEAGYDPHADNPSSTAYGIAQNINPSTYPPAGRPGSSAPIMEQAKAQLSWMINYIKGRYGTPSVAKAGYFGANLGGPPGYDEGGVVSGGPIGAAKKVVAHVGETILPTHKLFQRGGFVGNAKRNLEDFFQDIRHAMDDMRGGKLNDFFNGLDKIFSSLDHLSEALDAYTTALNDALVDWEFAIRKHTVVQVRTNVRVAKKQLNNLEKINDRLRRELDVVDKDIRLTKRRLDHADHDQKDKLRAALQKLYAQQGSITDALTQNLQDRFDQQQAVLDAIQERFQNRLDRNDLLSQIVQARGDILGKPLLGQQRDLLQRRGNILEDQQDEIRKEIRQARRRHDDQQVRALTNALLENKLAILENTKATKDLDGTNKKVIEFNSTAWQLWRVAIFNAQGGVMPNMPIPSLQTGGRVIKDGAVYLHAGEVVHDDKAGNDKIDINITQPMEVADPIALSNAIGFKLKHQKAVSR